LNEANGYLGGYLVTNRWGRPLEFRLSSAVQPNRVQQVLYAGTLQAYLCADLIGKTLVDKAGVGVQLIFTDREVVLDLRLKVDVPVLWLAAEDEERAVDLANRGQALAPLSAGGPIMVRHSRHPEDAITSREVLAQMDDAFDYQEPFCRVREAIAEARKMGVGNRG
jgi:hypothetical protein